MTAKPYLKKSVRLHREASELANKARIAQFDGDEIAYFAAHSASLSQGI